jgi:ferredoxin
VSGWKLLKSEDLGRFLDELAAHAEVIVPQKKGAKWGWDAYRPGTEVRLPASLVDTSAKDLFFPRRRPIARFNAAGDWDMAPVEAPTAVRVVVGMHPCDVAALAHYDRVMRAGQHADRLYASERDRTLILGMACSEMKPTCHCTDRGLAPDATDGMDAVLAETEGGWLVRAVSERGAKLVSSKLLAATDKQPASRDWPKGRYPVPGADELLAMYDDEFWTDQADICLTCGACTLACPSCTCFLVADEKHGGKGERVTCWDSCQFLSYSRETSGHNPRRTNASRLRNRTLDKFCYTVHRYGAMSCTGCGRCAIICPIKRSFPQLGAKLAQRAKQRAARAEVKK